MGPWSGERTRRAGRCGSLHERTRGWVREGTREKGSLVRTRMVREDGARALMRARVGRIVSRPGSRPAIGRDARRDAQEWMLRHPCEAARQRRCPDAGTNELFTDIESAEEDAGEIVLSIGAFRGRLVPSAE